jgi:galactokinase
VFRAPGRVNLIGEHTDYNDGFVMPAAIDFATWVAASANGTDSIRAYSVQYNESVTLTLNALTGPPTGHWSDFLRGVTFGLLDIGPRIVGADLLIDGQVPLGAGLSSSAALEVATATALLGVSDAELAAIDVVKVCQSAEHNFVGTRCGIMDQFISRFGEVGHALLLDCRSLQARLVPIPLDVRIVICNTMVKHQLSGGEYNERRADCEEGVRILQTFFPGIHALRDVTLSQLEEHKASLPVRVYRRCRHVISENARTVEAADALSRGDLHTVGKLMAASHESLRTDYEVSCAELDAMVAAAMRCEGVIGARMTGGGFGGCTVNLVAAEKAAEFREKVADKYRQATGITPAIYVTSAAQAASEVPVQN